MSVLKISDSLFVVSEDSLEEIKEAKEAFMAAVKEEREKFDERAKKLAKAYFAKIAPMVGLTQEDLDSEDQPAIKVDDEYDDKGFLVLELVEKKKGE
jgi:hypothetical protein